MTYCTKDTYRTVLACALLAAGCSAEGGEATKPDDGATETVSEQELERRRAAIHAYFDAKRATMKIRATTELSSGHVVDWIDADSQAPDGRIAAPPPPLEDIEAPLDPARSDLELDIERDPGARGPEGTVPVYRPDSDFVLRSIELPETVEEWLHLGAESSHGGSDVSGALHHFGHTGFSNYTHQYASATQNISTDNLYGTDAYIYVANPSVWLSREFSLAQLAIRRGNQTVEGGWQDFKNKYGDNLPHFFVFYTTNTSQYGTYGDNIGGYNTEYDGWVQSSTTLAPGAGLSSGTELYMRVLMFSGNWWVYVNNQWVGYYPGSLYSTSGLRNNANRAQWFGELIDYVTDGETTHTDMGTGRFANESGAAYIRNMRWENTTGTQSNLNATFQHTLPGCWTVAGANGSATTWRTYMYFGGPGNDVASCP